MWPQINIINALLVSTTVIFAVSVTRDYAWPAALVLCLTMTLKGFCLYIAKPSKKDELAAIEEKLKQVSSEINGLKLRLGFSQRAS